MGASIRTRPGSGKHGARPSLSLDGTPVEPPARVGDSRPGVRSDDDLHPEGDPMPRPAYVLNGPNLDMLGEREPELYGTDSLDDARSGAERVAAELGFELFFAQTNAESQMIEWLHDAYRADAGVVINPAGFSFHSVPVLDALKILRRPIVEVHITNIHGRDEAQRHSLTSAVATTVIAGAGIYGYEVALRVLDRKLGV
jgi:3-dehydroquinate dehydratase II